MRHHCDFQGTLLKARPKRRLFWKPQDLLSEAFKHFMAVQSDKSKFQVLNPQPRAKAARSIRWPFSTKRLGSPRQSSVAEVDAAAYQARDLPGRPAFLFS